MQKPTNSQRFKPETRLVAAGRRFAEHGFVNPAVYHASTVLFPTVEACRKRDQEYTYGRRGTPTAHALEEAITELEGGHHTRLMPSGLSAISTALLAVLKTGDHLLVTDSVYRPTREFCDGMLSRMGIETEYYDPLMGGGIAERFRSKTRLVVVESPGSQTMEVQDVPAIAEAARKAGILTAIDNTWATGAYFPAIAAGCDISMQALTKYVGGHSDAMLGAVTVTEPLAERLDKAWNELGLCAGPDDTYLGLRGIRSLSVRLARHMESALKVAAWLREREEIEAVFHPGLPGAPGHDLWKRDFKGSSGLFSIVFKPCSDKAFSAFVDDLEHFGIGFSWGGFESLAVPFNPTAYRTATRWRFEGPALRLHIGLENPEDLIADLETGFERMRAGGK
ncbi:MAG: cystathionine beta-lyase [Parvibaculaceae bacterium]